MYVRGQFRTARRTCKKQTTFIQITSRALALLWLRIFHVSTAVKFLPEWSHIKEMCFCRRAQHLFIRCELQNWKVVYYLYRTVCGGEGVFVPSLYNTPRWGWFQALKIMLQRGKILLHNCRASKYWYKMLGRACTTRRCERERESHSWESSITWRMKTHASDKTHCINFTPRGQSAGAFFNFWFIHPQDRDKAGNKILFLARSAKCKHGLSVKLSVHTAADDLFGRARILLYRGGWF
jgi:hypothetical protein